MAHVAVQRGIDVHTVGDHLDGHPWIVQQGDHRSRLAVVDWPHGIEQVSSHGGSSVDRRTRLRVGGLGVAHRSDGPGIDHSPDRGQRPGALRREGHHPDRPVAGGQHRAYLDRIGIAEQHRIVSAATLLGQPGTLEMDACDQPRPHINGQTPHLLEQIAGSLRHQ